MAQVKTWRREKRAPESREFKDFSRAVRKVFSGTLPKTPGEIALHRLEKRARKGKLPTQHFLRYQNVIINELEAEDAQ